MEIQHPFIKHTMKQFLSAGLVLASLLSILNAHLPTRRRPTVRAFHPRSALKYTLTVSQGNLNINQWFLFLAGSKVTTHLHNSQLNKQQRAAVLRGRQAGRLMGGCNTNTSDSRPGASSFCNQSLIVTVIQTPLISPGWLQLACFTWKDFFFFLVAPYLLQPFHRLCMKPAQISHFLCERRGSVTVRLWNNLLMWARCKFQTLCTMAINPHRLFHRGIWRTASYIWHKYGSKTPTWPSTRAHQTRSSRRVCQQILADWVEHLLKVWSI